VYHCGGDKYRKVHISIIKNFQPYHFILQGEQHGLTYATATERLIYNAKIGFHQRALDKPILIKFDVHGGDTNTSDSLIFKKHQLKNLKLWSEKFPFLFAKVCRLCSNR